MSKHVNESSFAPSAPTAPEGIGHPPRSIRSHPEPLDAYPGLTFPPARAWEPRPSRDPPEARGPETAPNRMAATESQGLVSRRSAFLREGAFFFFFSLSLFFSVAKLPSRRFEEKNKLTAMEILILEKCQESKHGFQ